MKNKQFHCFSMKLASYLMWNNCVLFEVLDCDDSRRKIYMFKDSEYLQNLLKKYKDDKDKIAKMF